MSLAKDLMSDAAFYWRKTGLGFVFNQGYQALYLYRWGRWAFTHARRINPVWYVYVVLKYLHMLFVKIELPVTCQIGQRLYLPHPYGLVMAGQVQVGNDCSIGAWTVIGRRKKGAGNPVLEDGVYLGPHVCILGDITVGAGSQVGPMSLLVKDVPPGSRVYGQAATVKPGQDTADKPPEEKDKTQGAPQPHKGPAWGLH